MVNSVKFFGKNVATVVKGFDSVVVGRFATTVMVVSTSRREEGTGRPLVLLIKEMNSKAEASDKMLYLVGKMCRKGPDSKYFSRQGVDYVNMSNGNPLPEGADKYLALAEELLKDVGAPCLEET